MLNFKFLSSYDMTRHEEKLLIRAGDRTYVFPLVFKDLDPGEYVDAPVSFWE